MLSFRWDHDPSVCAAAPSACEQAYKSSASGAWPIVGTVRRRHERSATWVRCVNIVTPSEQDQLHKLLEELVQRVSELETKVTEAGSAPPSLGMSDDKLSTLAGCDLSHAPAPQRYLEIRRCSPRAGVGHDARPVHQQGPAAARIDHQPVPRRRGSDATGIRRWTAPCASTGCCGATRAGQRCES